jgi:glycosyltransferase involved in cell wall biosynthesis
LIPHKGLPFALEALTQPGVEDWNLLVAGTGPRLDDYRDRAERLGLTDRVTFLGHVGRDQVEELLRTVDAMVAPSMYEGSGFAVAEAVTYGCPVVGTRRGGIEVIVPEDRGTLVPADADLATSLAEALADLGPRHAPTDLWSPARLDDFVQGLYGGAGAQRP